MRTRSRPYSLCAAALGLAATGASAGPLTPPAGPVVPSHKTLTDVEPRTPVSAATTPGNLGCIYRITQPGSYYLTGNITGESGKSGIQVVASNVTLDLNGFTVQGIPGSFDGITSLSVLTEGVTIRNGVIRDWGSDGVRGGGEAFGWRVENITAFRNGGSGIELYKDSVVSRCVARDNANGITTSEGAVVEHCRASANAVNGIRVGPGSSVTGSTADHCGGTGIIAGTGSAVDGCAARENEGAGIEIAAGCTVSACAAANNGAQGIYATGQSTVIRDCSAISNGGHGISGGASALVADCAVSGNTLNGIMLLTGSQAIGCTVLNNGDDGIELQGHCTVARCQIRANTTGGKAGIFAYSSGSRIEDNNVVGNALGIFVTGTNNFIARNTARDNTAGDFSVAAGNDLAPIITNPGATNFVGVTPWSNFAY